MESIFAVFGSLPVILALALFVGVVILVRILLSPEGAFERRTSHDRRQLQMPPLPFYDSERFLVTRDRRNSDRRKRRFVIMSTQRRA